MKFSNLFKSSSTRNQYIAALSANIINLSHGCAMGWLSPFLPYLQSTETHLKTGPVTSEDISWIGSLICVGGFVGAIIFGKATDFFGKRNSMFMLVIPHLGFWFLVFFSTHVYHLYLARFFAGVTGGGCLRTFSLYIVEISENNIRGSLGSLSILVQTIGVLLIFIVGTYVNFFVAPIICLAFSVIYVIALCFLPDTPTSLLSRNKSDEAFESLKFYRTCAGDKFPSDSVRSEFEQLKKALETKNEEKLSIKDFRESTARKGMILGVSLVFIKQFSGQLAFVMYTTSIFKNSGSNLSPNESSIVVAFIQFIGVCIAGTCVDRFGRKILMTISCAGSAFFLFILATYFYLNEFGYDMTGYSWIPVTSMSFTVFVASIGILPLPTLILTELLPLKVRNLACTLCLSLQTLLGFVILKIFPTMTEILDLYGCMWFFSGICFLGALLAIIFLPETKGKNLVTVMVTV